MAITVLGFLRVVGEDESIFICRHWDNVERQKKVKLSLRHIMPLNYEGWNFNSGNYLFTTGTK